MLRNGLPYNPKAIESNKAKDLPLPLLPHTRVVDFSPNLTSVKLFPNEPKFLNRTVLNTIMKEFPYRLDA